MARDGGGSAKGVETGKRTLKKRCVEEGDLGEAPPASEGLFANRAEQSE